MCKSNMFNPCILIFSFVIALVISILYFFCKLPLIIIPVAVSLGIAVVTLLILGGFSTFLCPNYRICLYKYGACTLLTAVGTILFATITLSRILLPLCLINSILIFFNTFFFISMIISLTMLFICLIRPHVD